MRGPLFVAKFKGTKGRYLVERDGLCYDGQRIMDARQLKYGNPPDATTGLFLHEAWRSFSAAEVVELKPFVRK